jgi:thiamine pyrophosphokinase
LLVVNGILPKASIITDLAARVDHIICTDGALHKLLMEAPSVKPHTVIGDLDSIDHSDVIEMYNCQDTSVIQLSDQNSTDLEKALTYLQSLGVKKIFVIGFNGLRYDHTITNLHVLSSWHHVMNFTLVDDFGYGVFRAGKYELVLDLEIGTTVSLLPLGEVGAITTKGLMYPLVGESLMFGVRSGQSNCSIASQVVISVDDSIAGETSDRYKGVLLIFILAQTFLDDLK